METIHGAQAPESGERRPVITKALVVCLFVAVAPWLTGGQEPIGLLVSGFALLLGALLAWKQPLGRRLKFGPLVVAYGLLIGLALLSLLWTANQYSSAVWIMRWVLAGLAFRLAFAIAGSPVGRKWVVNGYLISAGVFSVVAVWMYLTSEYGRLTGTFYWANPAAAYLMPAILMGLDRIRGSAGRVLYGWMGLTAWWGACFWLADSRATTAVLLLVGGLYLLLVRLDRRFWINLLFTSVVAFLVSYGLVQLSTITVQHSNKVAPGSRYIEAVKGESMSGSDRLYYLGSAIDMWRAHPLGGVGAGAYGDVHPQYQGRVVSASSSAHDVYAQILAELGVGGVVLVGSILVLLALGALRGLARAPELLPLALGAMGLLLHFGLDIDANYPALLSLVGVFFGLLYVSGVNEWVKLKPAWPAVAALVLLPVVPFYLSEVQADRGAAAQADGDYELAADYYHRSAGGAVFNPDHVGAEGINLFVLSTLRRGSESSQLSETALKLAKNAQRLDPHDGQHYLLEGRILVQRGDVKGAEAAFKAALVLDRFNHPDYALDLAALQVRENRLDDALKTVQAMLDQYPAGVVANRVADETLPPSLANLEALRGNVYLEQGGLDEARKAADRALALDPKSLRGRALAHQLAQ